jgi:hypothetical protein
MQYHIEYHMAFFGDREKLANGQRRAHESRQNRFNWPRGQKQRLRGSERFLRLPELPVISP